MLPLSFLSSGETAKVERIRGTEDTRKRVVGLGITPGTLIQMYQRVKGEVCVVKIDESRIILDNAISSKIFVTL